jgi:hypothetical protein
MGNPIPRDNMLVQEPTEAYTVKYMFEKFGSDNPEDVMTSSSLCKNLKVQRILKVGRVV